MTCAGTSTTAPAAASARVCGSRLFWDRGRATISIAAGSVDEPTGLTTSHHIYTASAGDWYDVPPGRPAATAG